MEKISAFLITRNEEKIIGRAIASLDWADEIIVVDGGSTDKTIELSKALGARVIEVSGDQGRSLLDCRNIALKSCQYPWVFFLDADEICSPELVSWILKFKTEGEEEARKESLESPSVHPLGKAKIFASICTKFEGLSTSKDGSISMVLVIRPINGVFLEKPMMFILRVSPMNTLSFKARFEDLRSPSFIFPMSDFTESCTKSTVPALLMQKNFFSRDEFTLPPTCSSQDSLCF